MKPKAALSIALNALKIDAEPFDKDLLLMSIQALFVPIST
jgi:hypothetical protein